MLPYAALRPVKKIYVLGFCVTQSGGVVLIHWNDRKEPWQRGKYNGIGGSVLYGESPLLAMVREFKEETGIDTACNQWSLVATLSHMDYDLFVFTSFGQLEPFSFESNEGVASIYDTLPEAMDQSARWLYMMCNDASAKGCLVTATL